MSRTNETRHIQYYETCKCKCRLDANVFKISNVRIMTNADLNVKNWLIGEECVIKDLFGTLLIMNWNVVNHMMLVII